MHDTLIYVKGMFKFSIYEPAIIYFLGGNCPGGNFPSWVGIIHDGNCPRWELSGWELSGWELSGWELSGGNCTKDGNCPGGSCPVGIRRVGTVLQSKIIIEILIPIF